MPTVHLLIKGKVQGVFYRASAKEKAGSLQVNGWIKNTPEGAVEALVTGTDESIKLFINWCKKGPFYARVNCVDVTETDDDFYDDFRIIK